MRRNMAPVNEREWGSKERRGRYRKPGREGGVGVGKRDEMK